MGTLQQVAAKTASVLREQSNEIARLNSEITKQASDQDALKRSVTAWDLAKYAASRGLCGASFEEVSDYRDGIITAMNHGRSVDQIKLALEMAPGAAHGAFEVDNDEDEVKTAGELGNQKIDPMMAVILGSGFYQGTDSDNLNSI